MAWQTPKTDWTPADGVTNSDFNRIESNINYIEKESRTPNQAATPAASGVLQTILDYIVTQIKKITGKTNWYDTPSITLETLKAHKSRHATGGQDALTPADIGAETPAGAQAKVDNHANRTDNPHNVTKAQIGLGNVEDKSAATIRQQTDQLRVEVVSSFPAHADGRIIAHTGEKKAFVSIGGEWV